MTRQRQVRKAVSLLALVTVAVAGAALVASPPPAEAQTFTPPPPLTATAVDFDSLAPNLSATFSGRVTFTIFVSGEKLGLSAYTTMNPDSTLRVVVRGPNMAAPPAGTYRVRFNFVNVGGPTVMNVVSGAQRTSCTLVSRPGYSSVQTCELAVPSNGSEFTAAASYVNGWPQIALKTVQVVKDP